MTKDEMRQVAIESLEYFTQCETALTSRERELMQFCRQWLNDNPTNDPVPSKPVPRPTANTKE